MRSLADHYAEALADVALAQNEAPQVRQELADFLGLLGESPDLSVVLTSPAVSRTNKQTVVEMLVQRMGAGRTMHNFLSVVLDHRRITLLPDIQQALDAQLDQRQGITRAAVTSAEELSEAEKAELRGALERLTGRSVEAHYTRDPELIAGAVVRIGSTIYDGSVRTRLERLRGRMATP